MAPVLCVFITKVIKHVFIADRTSIPFIKKSAALNIYSFKWTSEESKMDNCITPKINYRIIDIFITSVGDLVIQEYCISPHLLKSFFMSFKVFCVQVPHFFSKGCFYIFYFTAVRSVIFF